MKLKIVTICACLSISFSNFSVKVQMSSAEMLDKRLSGRFGHLMEKTKIIESLADREIEVMEIAKVIDSELSHYLDATCSYVQDAESWKKTLKENIKPGLYQVILQDFPQALKELEEKKL